MNVLEEQVFRTNPGKPIEEGARAIHGISNEDVASCPTPAEIVQGFPTDLCFIAHNAIYDQRVLGDLMIWSAELCTLALARRWVKDSKNHKLTTLKEHFGLSEQKAHSALGDCRTVLELLRKLSEVSGRSLGQLIDVEREPKMLNSMPFGMHKGKLFHDIPSGYRNWMLDLPDLHKDIRYTLERLKIV